ncbi:MAG: hypothetical protein KBC17_00670 [Candidatus Pacebacteria bacterium]|nr:hypothetical protein [Candidatus Paceibacterota bacterium]
METKTTITIEMAQTFFDSIPKDEILRYAKNIQKLIQDGDTATVTKKDDGTLVTEADTKIEQMIVDCFNRSALSEFCSVKGEEGVANAIKKDSWTLVIDPIDGSSSLVKGKDTWGVMVGFTDQEGILRYSWNLISTGETFQTSGNSTKEKRMLLKVQKNILVDFYDYKSRQESIFQIELEKLGLKNYELTSCPSAVTAGWKLFTGELSALVWVLGENEKKTYPDYDLLFLAPLMEMGYSIRIGKLNSNENAIIIVAPTNKDADELYVIALEIVTKNVGVKIKEIKNVLAI